MSNSPAVDEHRAHSPRSLKVAVLTVSDTRTLDDDTSGALIVEVLEAAGHLVADRGLVRDEPDLIRPLLEANRERDFDATLVTGGSGISPRDRTFEAATALFTATIPGFGELFRMLSYAEIGSAAILSRAVGGLIGRHVVLVMPGSRAAVRLAMEKIVIPELPHLVREARK